MDATHTNRVTATTVVDLHNSPKEVGDLAYQFLLDFSQQLPVDQIMRNFTNTCPEAVDERGDVARSNEQFRIVDYRVDEAVTTVAFSGVCPFRSTRGDACAQVPVFWRSVDKRTGAVGATRGTDQVTALRKRCPTRRTPPLGGLGADGGVARAPSRLWTRSAMGPSRGGPGHWRWYSPHRTVFLQAKQEGLASA